MLCMRNSSSLQRKILQGPIENCKLDLLVNPKNYEQFPRSWRHFEKLVEHPDFQPDLGPYLRKLEDLGKYLNPGSSGGSSTDPGGTN